MTFAYWWKKNPLNSNVCKQVGWARLERNLCWRRRHNWFLQKQTEIPQCFQKFQTGRTFPLSGVCLGKLSYPNKMKYVAGMYHDQVSYRFNPRSHSALCALLYSLDQKDNLKWRRDCALHVGVGEVCGRGGRRCAAHRCACQPLEKSSPGFQSLKALCWEGITDRKMRAGALEALSAEHCTRLKAFWQHTSNFALDDIKTVFVLAVLKRWGRKMMWPG